MSTSDDFALQLASLFASNASDAAEVAELTRQRDDFDRQACKAMRCEDHVESARLFALSAELTDELCHEYGVDPEDD